MSYTIIDHMKTLAAAKKRLEDAAVERKYTKRERQRDEAARADIIAEAVKNAEGPEAAIQRIHKKLNRLNGPNLNANFRLGGPAGIIPLPDAHSSARVYQTRSARRISYRVALYSNTLSAAQAIHILKRYYTNHY